jgi:hypothetical protein
MASERSDHKTQGAAMTPTIDDVKALQRRCNLLDVHVCWIGPESFVIAHTDEERATIDLEDCDLHGWLRDESGPPERVGYYIVTPHEVDAYSEPYPVARFDFTPLDTAEGAQP